VEDPYPIGAAPHRLKENSNAGAQRTGHVKGAPLTLLGHALEAGDTAPDFTAVDNDLREVRPADFAGSVLILSAVPSLDTPTCDMETRRFNKEAADLDPGIRILTVSMDLPFAQKRWCGAAGVERVKTISDHREASFGLAYGVLIKELRLLARAVFVVGRDGRLAHVQIVPEIASEPDYESALSAVRSVL
jgi:thioredoxin-dependent peroxiredoxin